jgi:16S rRNA (guanine527-N7)-methyltransferase
MESPVALVEVLAEAQSQGAIGPGSLNTHIAHALDFARGAWPESGLAVDLGSGGGLPGLPLAVSYPGLQWVLIDAWARRADGLRRAVQRLGLEDRVDVRHQRAEDAGRSALRATASVVVARGFGPPAFLAECAAPLLTERARLVVSVPEASEEGSDDRWPATGLAVVGLAEAARWQTPHGSFREFLQGTPCPDRYPRRSAAMSRRPIF